MGLTELVEHHKQFIRLKNTTRYSTCQLSMQESTADHICSVVALIPPTIDELKLPVDELKSIKIAIYHDTPEYTKSQDIDSIRIANGEVSKKEKNAQEAKVMTELLVRYGRQDVYDAWLEYEQGKTPEAKFVRAMNNIEALIHITSRGSTGRKNDADHTALYADERVLAFPLVTPLLREVKSKLKAAYEKQGLEWKPEYDKV